MSESNGHRRHTIEKRGGYTGGKPASAAAPPPTTPSGSARPQPPDTQKKAD